MRVCVEREGEKVSKAKFIIKIMWNLMDSYLLTSLWGHQIVLILFGNFFSRRHYLHHVQNHINPKNMVLSVYQEINFLIPAKCHSLSSP